MAVHGKQTVFKIDNSSGALTDISTYCDNIDFPQNAETVETTGFGATYKSHIGGFVEANISISGSWDATLDGVLGALNGVTGSFEYGPGGSLGNIKYTGECVCTSYQINAGVGARVGFSASFMVTGAVTRGTY
jgi:hypothetical protein